MRKVLLKLRSSRTVNSTTSGHVSADYRYSCWSYRRGGRLCASMIPRARWMSCQTIVFVRAARSSDQYCSRYVLSVNWYQCLLQILLSQCGVQASKTLTNQRLYLQHRDAGTCSHLRQIISKMSKHEKKCTCNTDIVSIIFSKMFLLETFSEIESGCTQGFCRCSHKVQVSVVQCEKKVDSVKLLHGNSCI